MLRVFNLLSVFFVSALIFQTDQVVWARFLIASGFFHLFWFITIFLFHWFKVYFIATSPQVSSEKIHTDSTLIRKEWCFLRSKSSILNRVSVSYIILCTLGVHSEMKYEIGARRTTRGSTKIIASPDNLFLFIPCRNFFFPLFYLFIWIYRQL